MAAKNNTSYSDIDKSSFYFAQKCGECHPGGGSLEYDRDGYKYFENNKFGWEISARDPRLDGDYTAFSGGDPQFGAPWNLSGVLEANCLICHLKNYDWKARSAALNGRKFLWAPTIGAGWADVEMSQDYTGAPLVKSVTVNYSKTGIAEFNNVAGRFVKPVPADNCWSCHSTADTKKRGRSLDPNKDIHIIKMNNCTTCHFSDDQHNFAKGQAALSTVRDDLDFSMKTCSDCHLKQQHKKTPYPEKHTFPPFHYNVISCEVCHIPYKEVSGKLIFDNASTGRTIFFSNTAFVSHDGGDIKRWRPDLKMRRGKIKPFKALVTIWWGALNKETGVLAPIPLWKIRDLKKPELRDDNQDGRPEINTFEEIKAFLSVLQKAEDKFGNPITKTAALAKGGYIYKFAGDKIIRYKDYQAECHMFSISHNVLPAEAAIGVKGCVECHSKDSHFFYRKILVDPYDEKGKPVFVPAWDFMGYTAERVAEITDLDAILEVKEIFYE